MDKPSSELLVRTFNSHNKEIGHRRYDTIIRDLDIMAVVVTLIEFPRGRILLKRRGPHKEWAPAGSTIWAAHHGSTREVAANDANNFGIPKDEIVEIVNLEDATNYKNILFVLYACLADENKVYPVSQPFDILITSRKQIKEASEGTPFRCGPFMSHIINLYENAG